MIVVVIVLLVAIAGLILFLTLKPSKCLDCEGKLGNLRIGGSGGYLCEEGKRRCELMPSRTTNFRYKIMECRTNQWQILRYCEVNQSCGERGCFSQEAEKFKETTYSLTMPSELGKIIDVNNDGLLDVIVLGEIGGGTKNAEGFVNIFYQNQEGQLILSENTYSIEHGADMINAGDVNNDGLNDIVITTDDNDDSSDVTAFLIQKPLNIFSLSFEPAPVPGAGCGEIGDINGDGLNDVVRGNKPRGSISIYYQNPEHNLKEPVEIFVNVDTIRNRTSDGRIGDFNNDGKNDFAVRNGVLLNGNAFFTVFYNIGNNKFNITNYDTGVTSNTGISDIRIGDFNNDGLKDIVVSIQQGSIGVYLQKDGDLEKHIYPSGINEIRGLGIGDLNNDSKDDIVASAFNCQTGISILLQEEGNFSRPFRLSSSAGFGGMVEVGDINNDGKNEIVTTNGLKLQTSNCPETSISVIEVNSDMLFGN